MFLLLAATQIDENQSGKYIFEQNLNMFLLFFWTTNAFRFVKAMRVGLAINKGCRVVEVEMEGGSRSERVKIHCL